MRRGFEEGPDGAGTGRITGSLPHILTRKILYERGAVGIERLSERSRLWKRMKNL